MKQSTRFPNPHHLKLEDKDSGQKALPTGQILVGDAVERLRQRLHPQGDDQGMTPRIGAPQHRPEPARIAQAQGVAALQQ